MTTKKIESENEDQVTHRSHEEEILKQFDEENSSESMQDLEGSEEVEPNSVPKEKSQKEIALDIYQKLSAPFEIEFNGKKISQLNWRVSQGNSKHYSEGSRYTYVPYITASQVEQRLNEVLGVDMWSSKIIRGGDETVCEITAKIGENWTTKSDLGTKSNVHEQKGSVSDSKKRAARGFGIGAYLVDIPNKTLVVRKNPDNKDDKNLYLCPAHSTKFTPIVNVKYQNSQKVNAYFNGISGLQGLMLEMLRINPSIAKAEHFRKLYSEVISK